MPKLSKTRVDYGDKAGAAAVDKIKGGDSTGSATSGVSRAGKAITSRTNQNTDNTSAASHKETDQRVSSGPGGSSSGPAV